MGTSEVIAFNDNQQAAIIGHALLAPALWEQFDELKVTKDWLVDAELGELWPHIEGFKKRYRRYPTPKELVESVKDDPKHVAAVQKTVDWCIREAADLGHDVLRQKLVAWAKARVMVGKAHSVRDKYNAGDHDGAAAVFEEAATELRRLDSVGDFVPDHFESAAVRVTEEEAQRLADTGKLLNYGIGFLDDALYGIIPHDLIMLGARSGAGKTEMATKIAAYNAREDKKRVAIFALEAEEFELERRIKYGEAAALYRHDHPGLPRGTLSYAAWRMGKLEKELKKYGNHVEGQFKKKYETLRTYYRTRGDFGLKELDREILRIHKDVDLVVLDHLHYVDVDANDENAEMHKLVKRLRHVALGLGVPILCVAHLRKNQGGVAKRTLVPGMDDFHGSSNISKIATTGIMLAPARDFVSADPRTGGGAPTFVRIVKNRLDGSRAFHVAVCFYDTVSGQYAKHYSLGSLNSGETKWTPVKKEPPPWAEHATITDVSEVD